MFNSTSYDCDKLLTASNRADISCPDDITTDLRLPSFLSVTLNSTALLQRPPSMTAASTEAVVLLSILFCAIGSTGIAGNLLVIVVILADKKMRRSVTNLFIMNLAVADLLIMLFGVPEIVQFMMNRGWVLGAFLCRFERSVLVCSLYASIMTLMAVCIERYIAIVHPIRAHILCSRLRTAGAIALIWPSAALCALPTMLFNRVRDPSPRVPVPLCGVVFPGNHIVGLTFYKIAEFVAFFFAPVVVQTVLYVIIGRRLFAGTKDLHRKTRGEGREGDKERDSGAIRARKGVVKMLISCVLVYFFSYAPVQMPLFYNLLLPATPFPMNWTFLVCTFTLSYVNSAANPILYAIFSQNFRRQFRRMLCRCLPPEGGEGGYKGGTLSMETLKTRRGTVYSAGRKASTTAVSEI